MIDSGYGNACFDNMIKNIMQCFWGTYKLLFLNKNSVKEFDWKHES